MIRGPLPPVTLADLQSNGGGKGNVWNMPNDSLEYPPDLPGGGGEELEDRPWPLLCADGMPADTENGVPHCPEWDIPPVIVTDRIPVDTVPLPNPAPAPARFPWGVLLLLLLLLLYAKEK